MITGRKPVGISGRGKPGNRDAAWAGGPMKLARRPSCGLAVIETARKKMFVLTKSLLGGCGGRERENEAESSEREMIVFVKEEHVPPDHVPRHRKVTN